MEYNTKRNHLTMPEYGRHIQHMVNTLRTIEDPEIRQKNAQAIIELMGVLNPHLKNVEDFRHKLWDHLFLIADFDLDVKSPYPIPTREKLFRRPERVPYPVENRRLRHLGKNLGRIIDKALLETDEEKRKGFTQTIAYYMKLAYTNWHRESVHDDMIKEELTEITGGTLNYTAGGIRVRFDNRHSNNYKKSQSNSRNYKGNAGGRNFKGGQGKNSPNKNRKNK